MADRSLSNNITIIMHYSNDLPYGEEKFIKMLNSITDQMDSMTHLILLCSSNHKNIEEKILNEYPSINQLNIINNDSGTLGSQLNHAVEQTRSDYFIYMDNLTSEIYLKKSATAVLTMAAERHPNTGLIYSDYELATDDEMKEIKLLKHHIGRLRDNQDYGRVFCFKKQSIIQCGGFDNAIKYNTLYDMRLKLAENHELIHISNRYAGSLYKVVAEKKGHNVFDYLLASKESQLESEEVLANHLKRIGAYLEAGEHYTKRPAAGKDASLQASVIIPVNNRAEFIGTAIESVLNQSVQDVEVIVVVNGGENDPTIAKVHEYMPGGLLFDESKPNVQCLVLDVNNIGACLNLGAKMAKGKYYVQLDSDDRLKPEAIQKILDTFDSDPKIGIVIGSYEVWEKDDKTGNISRVDSIPVVTHDEWTEENGRNNLLRINGAGAPRSIPIQLIKDIGYFGINDEPFARNYGEDYEMVLKISERHRVGRIWEPIYDVVRHSGGTDHNIDVATIDRNDEAKDYMRLQAIERRKKLISDLLPLSPKS